MTWYIIKNNTIVINIWAKPNAKASKFVAIDERGIHISIQAKADEGKANKALIDFLANQIGIPKKSLQLIKGSKSRFKQIVINYDEGIIAKLEEIDRIYNKSLT